MCMLMGSAIAEGHHQADCALHWRLWWSAINHQPPMICTPAISNLLRLNN